MTATTDLARRAMQICDELLRYEPTERPARCTEFCAGDEVLRRMVDDLLQAIDDSGRFLAIDLSPGED